VHRSVYAGLSYEEYAQKRAEAVLTYKDGLHKLSLESFAENTLSLTPNDDLEEILGLMRKDTLVAFATSMVSNPSRRRKAELIQAIVSQLSDPRMIQEFLLSYSREELDVLRRILQAGGRLDLSVCGNTEKDETDEALFASQMVPLIIVFDALDRADDSGATDDPGAAESVTAVIPRQLREPLNRLVEDGYFDHLDLLFDIRQCATAAAELYGVLPIDLFESMCREFFPDAELTREEIETILIGSIWMKDPDYVVDDVNGIECLLWHDLWDDLHAYDWDEDEEADDDDDDDD